MIHSKQVQIYVQDFQKNHNVIFKYINKIFTLSYPYDKSHKNRNKLWAFFAVSKIQT